MNKQLIAKMTLMDEIKNDRKNRSAQERRVKPRLAREERLFVQVLACPQDDDLVGTTLACRSSDLSATGIKIKTESAVPIGTVLDLWVDVQGRRGKFFLSGEVMWCEHRPEDDYYLLGIELDEKLTAITDITDWKVHFTWHEKPALSH